MLHIPHYLILQYADLKTFQSFILTCKDNLNDCKNLYLWKIHQYYLRCGYLQWYADRNTKYKPDFFLQRNIAASIAPFTKIDLLLAL